MATMVITLTHQVDHRDVNAVRSLGPLPASSEADPITEVRL